MNSFTIQIRKDRLNKDGKAPLIFISSVDGEQAKKSTNLYILPNDWDVVGRQVTNIKNNVLVATKIAELKAKAERTRALCELNNETLNAVNFLDAVMPALKKIDKTCFYDVANSIFNDKKVSYHRYKHYKTFLSQLKLFTATLKINDVNYMFCVKFFNWIDTTYKNHTNTKVQKLKIFNLVLNEAVKREIITKNTILQFNIKREQTRRTALNDTELKNLEVLYYSNKLTDGLQNTLRGFLIMAYTGLRHSDLLHFNVTNIENNVIKIKQNKTNEWVHIPIIAKAKQLLASGNFYYLSNQTMNYNLKEIKTNHIITTKPLTCHIARHTFATIGLNCGVPLEVVSEVLGHKSLAVTRIYAKMNDTYKIEQMAKWGV